jgi:hypothetical protein
MFKERVAEILGVVGEIAWRGFGIFLFVLGGAAGSGAVITGDPVIGVLVAWSTLMIGVVAAIGYAIAVTGKASKATVAKAAQDAVQKFEEGKK